MSATPLKVSKFSSLAWKHHVALAFLTRHPNSNNKSDEEEKPDQPKANEKRVLSGREG